MPADLFIGLVTHPNSRFPVARTSEGLLAKIAVRARTRGLSVDTMVVDEDLLSPEMLTINPGEVRASIEAELCIERWWREYVRGVARLPIKERVKFSIRRWKRKLQYVPPWRKSITAADPGSRMLRRLANIELAHMAAMREAIASEAAWVLLLEDDARTQDAASFADELFDFMNAASRTGAPGTINLSESFTISQLGIGHLLTPASNLGQPPKWHTQSSSKIVTNTVCAVLYRRDYLSSLLAALEEIPLSPVIPIDFKVNQAVLDIKESWGPGTCWVVSPAPIEQGSGVPQIKG